MGEENDEYFPVSRSIAASSLIGYFRVTLRKFGSFRAFRFCVFESLVTLCDLFACVQLCAIVCVCLHCLDGLKDAVGRVDQLIKEQADRG